MSTIKITPTLARRVAIAAQHLTGPYPPSTPDAMLNVLKQIRCLQLDPIRAVERTQYLVLWSRLGNYDREHLHQLAYQDRHLFEYWAHAASLVFTEDYPLHEYLMRHYGQDGSSWSQRLANWVEENHSFRQYILDELAENGPLLTQSLENRATVPWASGGWTSGRSVAYMMDYLWSSGKVMVAKRDGLKRWWDLAEQVLPEWTPAGGWTAAQVTRDAAQKSLKALGVGRVRDIGKHFIEGRYPDLNMTLPELQEEGLVHPIEIEGWSGDWYIHHENLPLLERIQAGDWHPRTTLLSPFDGLIRDRERTELMWDFHYRIEIYVPKAKRQYGYYVLPILHGDQLIGRIDPKMDRKKGVLTVNAIHVEPTAPLDRATGQAVVTAIQELGEWLGAKEIVYGSNVPQPWQKYI